jgi:hypothetical protein
VGFWWDDFMKSFLGNWQFVIEVLFKKISLHTLKILIGPEVLFIFIFILIIF